MSRLHWVLVLAVVASSAAPAVAAKGKKLSADEVLEKHLASIGAAVSRAQRSSVRATGKANLVVLVGTERKLEGEAKFVAAGRQFRSSIIFGVSDYPAEEVSFDGKNTYANQLNPGQRSLIGGFIYRYEEILTEGLLGGTLSTGWSLLHVHQLNPKLKYKGLRKFGESQLHEMEYQRKKGRRDVKVNLYFLPETFHHVATIYRLEVPPSLPEFTAGSTASSRAATSSSQVGTRITLEEYFSDFRAVEGLALPFRWKVRLTGEGPEAELAALGLVGASRSLAVLEWNVQFDRLELNVDLNPAEFRLY